MPRRRSAGPKAEERKEWVRHPGRVSFGSFSLARAKKSYLPWVNHPQALIINIDGAPEALD
jgi:hypothetical protein